MAYAIRWYHEFYDKGNNLNKIELLEQDYAGVSTRISHGSSTPVTFGHNGDKSNRENVIIQGQQLTFSFQCHRDNIDTFDTVFESEYKKYQIKYYLKSQLEFIGWIKSENMSKSFLKNSPYIEINIPATDGIADLSEVSFLDTNGSIISTKKTILEILKLALTPIDITLDFEIQLGTYESNLMTSTSCALEETEVDCRRFIKDNDGIQETMSCLEVIQTVLKGFSVIFHQYRNAYHIINYHELDSYVFNYDWNTLTQQSRTATNNIVDISSYGVTPEPEVSKIRPLVSAAVKHLNRDLGGDLTGGRDLTDWTGSVWDIQFYASSETDDIVTLSSKSSTEDNYIELQSTFAVTKVTDDEYIKLVFDHLRYEYTGTGIPETVLEIKIYKPDGNWWTMNYNPSIYGDWSHFDSPMDETFRITATGNYNIRIKVIPNPSGAWVWDDPSPVISFKMGGFAITKAYSNIASTDAVVYDKYYKQYGSPAGIEKYETELLLADTYQLTEIGGLSSTSSILEPTSTWRSYGHTEDIPLVDLYIRNILNNRFEYKNYIRRIRIIDRNVAISFHNILTIHSRNYIFVSFERDCRNCIIEADLIELLTDQQSYSTISIGNMSTVNGEKVTGSSVVNPIYSSVPSHNNLTGLQGGQASQYYHLTQAQHTSLSNMVVKTGTPLDNQIAVFTAANTIEGTSGLTFDGNAFIVQVSDAVVSLNIKNSYLDNLTTIGLASAAAQYSSLALAGDTVYRQYAGNTLFVNRNNATAAFKWIYSTAAGQPEIEIMNLTGDYLGIKTTYGFYINDINTKIAEGTGNSFKLSTDSGYIEVGAQNSGYCHFISDLPAYYFNKKLIVDEGILSSYDEDLVLQRATTTKVTIASSSITFEDLIYTKSDITHTDFTSGFQGTNYKIWSNGNAEFSNIMIRGGLTAYELIINQLRYQNGGLIIGPGAGKVSSIVNGTKGEEQLTFEDPEGNSGVIPFTAGALVIIQEFDIDRTTVIKKIVRLCLGIGIGGEIGFTEATGWDPDVDDVGDIEVGDEMVAFGNTTDTDLDASIYMSAVDSGNPFLRVLDGVDSYAKWSLSSKTCVKLQLGNLASLASYDILPASPGYGLYCNNVYLTGKMVLPSAGMTDEGATGSSVRIYAGDSYANRATADFRVTQDGDVYANGNLEACGAVSLGTVTTQGEVSIYSDIQSYRAIRRWAYSVQNNLELHDIEYNLYLFDAGDVAKTMWLPASSEMSGIEEGCEIVLLNPTKANWTIDGNGEDIYLSTSVAVSSFVLGTGESCTLIYSSNPYAAGWYELS